MNIFLSAFVLLYFVGEKCCLQKLKEREKFLRSSSLEMQGQILRANGDRAKAQGQHNAEGGLETNPLPSYVAVKQILPRKYVIFPPAP